MFLDRRGFEPGQVSESESKLAGEVPLLLKSGRPQVYVSVGREMGWEFSWVKQS